MQTVMERLERENRQLKRVGAALLLVLAAGLLASAARPQSRTVEAERFILKDGGGRTRAVLGVWADTFGKVPALYDSSKGDSPSLRFYDTLGQRRAAVGIVKESIGGLEISDPAFSASLFPVEFGIHDKYSSMKLESHGLELSGGEGKAGLAVLPKLGPTLHLGSGEQSKGSVILNLSPDGQANLQFFDKSKAARRAMLTISADGAPSLELFDASGNTRAVLGNSELEAPKTGTVEKRPESSLVLFDKDGKVIWQAP
jgi:hypothetical protein